MNRRFAHGGNVYDAAPAGREWLDFSANINPLGLSEKVRRAIEDGIENLVHYPDPAARALKQAIVERRRGAFLCLFPCRTTQAGAAADSLLQ